jgi:hypothetical protein
MPSQYLVEIFLPLFARKGKRFPARLHAAVRAQLVTQFGGMTAHLRTPVLGLWKASDRARAERDILIIYEVMTPRLKRSWWVKYRRQLEETFCQEELVIRAQKIRTL